MDTVKTEMTVNMHTLCWTACSQFRFRKKDTTSKLHSESLWQGFSAQGQKPLLRVDRGSHGAQSARQNKAVQQNYYVQQEIKAETRLKVIVVLSINSR